MPIVPPKRDEPSGEVLEPAAVAEDETFAVAVHPNNPDAMFHDKAQIEKLADRMRRKDGRLIIDEAFCDTDPDKSFVPHMVRNMVILKSFGKFFGLAGVRLGFAICDRQLAARIADWFGPWAVSGPALEIGAAALADREWTATTRLVARCPLACPCRDVAGPRAGDRGRQWPVRARPPRKGGGAMRVAAALAHIGAAVP